MPDSEAFDYLYKEYVRTCDKCDSYAMSSFQDFKLLGGIGVVAAWKPIADKLSLDSPMMLFWGFLTILIVVGIIAIRDLLKMSIIGYYLGEVCIYGKQLRNCQDELDSETFRMAEHWERWNKVKHKKISSLFYMVFALVLFLVPASILISEKAMYYALLYSGIVAFFIGAFVLGSCSPQETVRAFVKVPSRAAI